MCCEFDTFAFSHCPFLTNTEKKKRLCLVSTMSLTNTVLSEAVNKDDRGYGCADRIPGLGEDLVSVLGLDPLFFGTWLLLRSGGHGAAVRWGEVFFGSNEGE